MKNRKNILKNIAFLGLSIILTISLTACSDGLFGNQGHGDDNKPNDNNTIQEFTVTFDANGGTIDGKTNKIVKVKKGQPVGKPTEDLEKSGYTFDAWYEKQDGTGSVYNFSKAVTKDFTLYAKWKENSNSTEPITNPETIKITTETTNPNTVTIKEKFTINLNDFDKLKTNPKIKDIIDNLQEGQKISLKNITINTFYKEQSRYSQSRGVTENKASIYKATPITPEFVNNTKLLTDIKLNNITPDNKVIEVPFNSNEGNHFDISLLAKFDFNEQFKLESNSKIFVKADRTPENHGNTDTTPYATTDEMVKLAKSKLKQHITVDNVKLRGNVKELLPYLVGNNKLKEINGGIKFNNRYKAYCTGISKTGYYGDEDGSILPVEQLQELHKRTDGPTTIYNAIIENLDCKGMTEEEIKNTSFNGDIIENIEFRDSNTDLTNISFESVSHTGTAIFNGVLPKNMSGIFQNLIIQDATIPQFNQFSPSFSKKHRGLPGVESKLTIKNIKILNNLKKLYQGWTKEQILKFTIQWGKPLEYEGPKKIYQELQRICPQGPSETIYFTDDNGNNKTGPYYEDDDGNFHLKNTTGLLKQINKGIYRG